MEDLMFDYLTFGKELNIPKEIIQEFEKEARDEFPFDDMLMELHVLRALKYYARVISRDNGN